MTKEQQTWSATNDKSALVAEVLLYCLRIFIVRVSATLLLCGESVSSGEQQNYNVMFSVDDSTCLVAMPEELLYSVSLQNCLFFLLWWFLPRYITVRCCAQGLCLVSNWKIHST